MTNRIDQLRQEILEKTRELVRLREGKKEFQAGSSVVPYAGDEVVVQFPGNAVPLRVLRGQHVQAPLLGLGSDATLVPGKDHPHQRDQRAGGDAADYDDPGDERGGSVQ